MTLGRKKAIVIGETKLCKQCVEYLLSKKWEIISIISYDKSVIDWAIKNSIPVLPIFQLDTVKENNFYLFSIVNPYVIPASFLTSKKILLALNYHDSLLPKYAGVNSTTWAIINNEKQHGVTIHKITSGIDEGDIAAQYIVTIDKDETAISLNLKCSEIFLSLFKGVVDKIETGTLKFSKQDLKDRIYYGLKHIPDNYGFINGIKDIEVLDRLVRGTTLGEGYDNPVATLKVRLKNNFYIAENFNRDLIIGNKRLRKNTILFNEVRDIYGNKIGLKIKYQDILTKFYLTKHDLQYLSDIKSQEGKYKKQILKFFEDHSDASLKILDHTIHKSNNRSYSTKISVPKSISTITLLTLVYFVLLRLFRDGFVISLYTNNRKIPSSLRNLVDSCTFIYAHQDELVNSFANLKAHLSQIQKKCYILTKDFGYRYRLQLLADIAVTIGEGISIDNHRMVIKIKEVGFEIQGNISFRVQIDSIAEVMKNLLSKNLNKEIAVKDLRYINILSRSQYQQIAYDWNKTEKNYPRDKTVHQLFEEQVLRTPNNIAVVYEDKKITYKELNQKANQLADYLCAIYKIKPDSLVVLCLDRSEQMLIAILGILKAGGAYVPIDPSYPDERIGYILNDNVAVVILTNDKYKSRLTKCINQGKKRTKRTDVVVIDGEEIQIKLVKQRGANPIIQTISTNLIYVIYTSGTTGDPKGVMVEHRSVVNFTKYLINYYKLTDRSVGGQYAAISFDAAVAEIYPIILSGGTLCIIPDEYRFEPALTNKFFIQNDITHAFLPTKFAESFFDFKNVGLTDLLVAGDKLDRFVNQQYRITNGYGTTECTVHSTSFVVSKPCDNIPIGKPINNVKCYVVDNNLNLLPIGAIGELVIGGESLARGYYNHPALTFEKFVSNPFRTREEKEQDKNNRLYKTGDLVRRLPNGNLEFVGRNDSQVKIRGFRVELGEIENKLLRYPLIEQVVVIVREKEEGSKYLVAYYVANRKLDQTKLYDYLLSQLPEYMVPNTFVYMQSFPLTGNGKLDKKALLELTLIDQPGYIAPRYELEKKMCEIYSHVLDLPIEKIGIRDDFLRMGGNSLAAIRLTNIINQQFESNIQVRDILNNSTIERIAQVTSNNANQFVYKDYTITSADIDNLYESFKLTNVQQAYYFGRFQSFTLGNTSAHSYVEYEFAFLDVLKLETALNELIARHYNLRMIFEDGKQRYLKDYPYYKVKFYQLNDISELESIRKQYSHKVYALDKLWLFDVFVTKFANKYILHFGLDGLIFDAYSIWIFLSELGKLYKDPLYELPKLNVSYRDYIKQYSIIRRSALFAKAKDYWLNHLDDYNFTFSLPLQKQPNVITQPKFARISKELDAKTWKKITTKANYYGIGQTVVLLQVYGHVLSYWSNQNKLCINLTLFNRLPLHKQVNNLIGDFTVLELFNYIGDNFGGKNNLLSLLKNTYNRLWDDIEHNLFDGLDFQRLIRNKLSLSLHDKIIAPIVLTSIFGIDYGNKKILDEPFYRIGYSITQTPQVWLDNKAYEREGRMVAEWDYVEELFDRKDIEAMHNHYFNLIKYVADADWEEDSLPVLKPPKSDQILINRANITKQASSEDTLFSRYESLVANGSFNERVAIICGGDHSKAYTYRELFEDSNLLARYVLSAIDIGDLDGKKIVLDARLIAVLSSKSYNQVLSILSVMKAGFGYLPLNVDWPLARIEKILDQAGVRILLISRKEYVSVGHKLEPKYQLIVIEEILGFFSANEAKRYELLKIELPQIKADEVAYVIFTSGSTGFPKGVTISHRGALNTIDAVNNKFSVTKQDVVLSISELAFDLSVYDIFGVLVVGGKIVFPAQHRVKEPKYWVELIKRYNITIWNTVPQLGGLLIDELEKTNDFDISSLRLFLLSGDWIPVDLPNRIKKYYQQAKVISLGGATEGSIWSIWYDIDKVSKDWRSIPYGVAMPNQRMYILNHKFEYCPVGVVGEIYIGGLGVALNYWRDQIRTDASFINVSKLGRLYKTGDLGRWCREGYIEFLGRKDNQIKIRGYRIELGEIENQLCKVPGVKQAIVNIVSYNNEKKIIAYVVPEKTNIVGNNKEISKARVEGDFVEQIKLQLTKQLPDYMMPSYVVTFDKIPLMPNGKVDVKALPKLEEDLGSSSKVAYVAPVNKLELKICTAYAEILNLSADKVGTNDDFFRIGGGSLLAIKLVSKLQQYIKINLSDLFRLKTPAKIAQQIPETSVGLSLFQKLQKVVQLYQTQKIAKVDLVSTTLKCNKYLQETSQLRFKPQLKNINNILLTGATGFLGCNILYQLLTTTNYKVYLLIRGDSEEHSYNRISNKFNLYFNTRLNDYKGRIVVLKSNLEYPNLGLTITQYYSLIRAVDSIIHVAALVKYYGEYDIFYQSNIQATINLLELARLTSSKDFHYISSNGIFTSGYIPDCSYHVFDESDTPEILLGNDKVYYKTKYEAEIIVRDYRKYGITSNIYRVGHLSAHSTNYRNQENIEDNSFFQCIKTMLILGAILEEDYLSIEMSPVDYVALAIIKIFNQAQLGNQTYHVFNPKLANLFELFSAYDSLRVQKLAIDKFVDIMLKKISISPYKEQIELFMLHRGWVQYTNYPNLTKVKILQNRTDKILNKLGFEWPEIHYKMLSEIVKIMASII